MNISVGWHEPVVPITSFDPMLNASNQIKFVTNILLRGYILPETYKVLNY